MQHSSDACVCEVRVLADEHGNRRSVRAPGINNDHAGFGAGELLSILGIGEEGYGSSVRIRERGDALDERRGISSQLTAEANRELAQRYGHGPETSARDARDHCFGFGAGAGAAVGLGPRACKAARIAGVMSSAVVA